MIENVPKDLQRGNLNTPDLVDEATTKGLAIDSRKSLMSVCAEALMRMSVTGSGFDIA